MRYYFLTFLIAGLGTYLFTPFAIKVSKKFNAIKVPSARDSHTKPTPELGGVAMLIGLILSYIASIFFPYFKGIWSSTGINPIVILICGIFVSVIGIIDDATDLDWLLKLISQFFIAGIIAFFGIRLVVIPFGKEVIILSNFISTLITVFIIVFLMNAINFIDGLNGLASGIVFISSSAFFIYAYIMSIQQKADTYASLAGVILCVLMGLCLGFLPRNFRKDAKIFMGDGGSQLLGFLFSITVILVVAQIDPGTSSSKQIIPMFLPILLPLVILIFPILDMIIAIVRRGWKAKSPFHADSRHIHHTLVKLIGNSKNSKQKVVRILYLWTFSLSYSCLLFIFLSIKLSFLILFVILIIDFIISFSQIRIAKKVIIEHYTESFRRK